MTSFAPAFAAIIGKKRRKIIEAFRLAAATTPNNAKTLAELGLSDSNLFKMQIIRKAIVPNQEDRYYLDERRMIEIQRQRRIIIVCVIIIACGIFYFLNH